jgi:hypothetical protein
MCPGPNTPPGRGGPAIGFAGRWAQALPVIKINVSIIPLTIHSRRFLIKIPSMQRRFSAGLR